MWCPLCRGEYVEGLERCPRCDVPLMAEGAPPEAQPGDRLPFAAGLGVFGVAAVFLVRSIGTFLVSPDVGVVIALASLQLLGYMALAFFFLAFLDEYARYAGWRSRLASVLTLVLTGVAAVSVALTLAALAGVVAARPAVLGPLSGLLSLLLPASAVLFFGAVRAESSRGTAVLRRASEWALAGSALMFAVHVAVAAGWSIGELAAPPPGARLPLAVVGVLVSAVAAATVVAFLLVVRRESSMKS